LTRKAGKRSAAGFVNALLRKASRERARLPLPAVPANSSDKAAALDYLSITWSHPRWLIERWLDRYGYDAALATVRFNNAPAALTLRVNTLANDRSAAAAALRDAGVATEPTRFASAGLVVASGNPLRTPLAHTGRFIVQDEASQLVGEFVDARSGESIFDACASPGGKTTQMAASMNDRGVLIAADVRPRRIDLLVRTVRESGATSIRVIRADAEADLPLIEGRFDAVLLDAPCSGLGTIRRDPDIRWRRSAADLPVLASAQLEMLSNAARLVTRGGRLIYATCSSEPEENDQVVDAFLASHQGFEAASPRTTPIADVLDDRGFLRTLPFRHGLEAFFAARLVRTRDLR
jgi:16S rRNA (cytosine967-C5)-methyltransferase